MTYSSYREPQQGPSIQYDNTINIDHVVNAQAEDQARVRGVLSFMSKTIGSLWPFQAGPNPDNQILPVISNKHDKFSHNDNSPSLYTPPPSVPCTPTKKPLSEQADEQLSSQSHLPRTPQRGFLQVSGLLTPQSLPRSAPICQATVISRGKPCTNKALPNTGYLVCGKHLAQLEGIRERQDSSTQSSSDSESVSTASPSTRLSTRLKRPPARSCLALQKPPSLDGGIQVAPHSSATAVKRRCMPKTKREGHISLASTPSAKARTPPKSRGDVWSRREELRSEFVPEHLTRDTQDVICEALVDVLTSKEGLGFIYCFEDRVSSSSDSLCLKIGYSTEPDRRFRQWKAAKCKPDDPIFKFSQEVSHHIRIEKLVHLHLADLARNAQHLRFQPNEEWATGPSVLRGPRIPYSKDHPFKPYGRPCTRCNTAHRELFQIELFPPDEDDEEDAEERAEREKLTIQLVRRVVEYWAAVALRIWSETPQA